MRWKLILLVPLIASLVGSGAALAIIIFLTGTPKRLIPTDIFAFGALLIPLAMIIAASVFVYRRTARRRKTQAMATALLSAILTLTIIFVCTIILNKKPAEQQPTPQPGKIASQQAQHN